MRRGLVVALLVVGFTVAAGVPGIGAGVASSHAFSGSRSTRTPAFRLPDHWSLTWSFDCSRTAANPGVFSVQVVQIDSSPSRLDIRIPRLARFDTSGSGVEHYDQGGGRAFLRIASQCPWTVMAARELS